MCACVCEIEKKLKDVLIEYATPPLVTVFCTPPRKKTIFLVQFPPTEKIKIHLYTMPGNIFHLLNAIFKYLLFRASLFSAACQCSK